MLDWIKALQAGVKEDPAAFTAAVFAAAAIYLFVRYLRSKDKHELTVAALNKQHDEELAKVNQARLEMAIAQATLFTRVLATLDELELFLKSRRRKPRKPTPSAGTEGGGDDRG